MSCSVESISPIRLVWAVSGRGMLLRAMCAAIDAGIINAHVSAIVIDRPSPIENFAAARGIRLFRVPPPGSDKDVFNDAIADAFARSGADWAGMTFNQLVGQKAVSVLHGKVFNIHFSILPLFPGLHPIKKALGSGMRVAGVTVHVADEIMDGGPILGQAVCGIVPSDTEETLGRRIFNVAVPLVFQTVRDISTGYLTLDAERRPCWTNRAGRNMTADQFPLFDDDVAAFSESFCLTI